MVHQIADLIYRCTDVRRWWAAVEWLATPPDTTSGPHRCLFDDPSCVKEDMCETCYLETTGKIW